MLSVIKLSVVMSLIKLIFVMLGVAILSLVMLILVMLNVTILIIVRQTECPTTECCSSQSRYHYTESCCAESVSLFRAILVTLNVVLLSLAMLHIIRQSFVILTLVMLVRGQT